MVWGPSRARQLRRRNAHGRGHVQGQLACTNATDRGTEAGHLERAGRNSWSCEGASLGGGHCVAKGA
jgi:hypothetical protein